MEEEKQEEKPFEIKYNISMQCSVCKDMNEAEYVMGVKEYFNCKKCGQKNNIVMTFIAIADNPQGIRTMMVEAPEKRRLNKNVGGVNVSDRRASNS